MQCWYIFLVRSPWPWPARWTWSCSPWIPRPATSPLPAMAGLRGTWSTSGRWAKLNMGSSKVFFLSFAASNPFSFATLHADYALVTMLSSETRDTFVMTCMTLAVRPLFMICIIRVPCIIRVQWDDHSLLSGIVYLVLLIFPHALNLKLVLCIFC